MGKSNVAGRADRLAVGAHAQNKRLVLRFIDEAFNRHRLDQAVASHDHERYVQHRPGIADGVKPFLDYMAQYLARYPDLRQDVKRVIAEGDFVVLHSHWRRRPGDPGLVLVDIFRVHDGRIVEHWDVEQEIGPDEDIDRLF